MTNPAAPAAVPHPHPSPDAMLAALEAIVEAGGVVELRALHPAKDGGKKAVSSGFYDSTGRERLSEDAERMNLDGAQVYVTINSVNPDLFARSPNCIKSPAGKTTADSDIVRRRWLPVDIDPVRPADTSATQEQHDAAVELSMTAQAILAGRGWPTPVMALSGNGVHLLYPIDLPNDAESKALVEGALAGLAKLFDTDWIKVDRSVGNAARIMRLYGTVATKGTHSAETPHRISLMLQSPPRVELTREQLQAIAPPARVNAEPPPVRRGVDTTQWQQQSGGFDVESFMARHGMKYRAGVHEGSERFKLAQCPFNPEHSNGEAAVFRGADGALGFKCFHNSCSDKHWRDVRELLEGPRPSRRAEVEEQIDVEACTAASAAKRTAANGPRAAVAEGQPAPAARVRIGNAAAPPSNTDMVLPRHLLRPAGMLGEFVDWVLETSQYPQPELALAAGLALFGTVLGRKVETRTGLRSNFYMVGIAGTARGKDHARKCVKRLLRDAGLGSNLGGEKIGSGAALLSRLAVQMNSLFMLDEFGMQLGGWSNKRAPTHQAEILQHLLMLFSSAGDVVAGSEYADQKARPRADIQYPCVNIYGTTTGETLWPALSGGDVESGFLNRLLAVAAPNARPPERDGVLSAPPERVVAWVKAVAGLSGGKGENMVGLDGGSPLKVDDSPMAKALFTQFKAWFLARVDALERERGKECLAPLWGRAGEHAAKVAMVLAVTKIQDIDELVAGARSMEVDSGSAAWAIDFVKHSLMYIEEQVGARVGDNDFDRDRKEVMRFIKRAGPNGCTQAEAARSNRTLGKLKLNEQRDILESLKSMEMVALVSFPAEGRGRGRNAWVAAEHLVSGVDEHE